jgi:HEAT repeat protein
LFRAVRPLASTAAGQLVDALLERRNHPLVRRRLPLILSRSDNLRAVYGLLECLDDEDPDVRLRCGQALNRIRSNHPHLEVPLDRVWSCIRADLTGLGPPAAAGSQPGDDRLHHLFNLLGVVYGPEILEICYCALIGEDPALRGTALELLDNQLPQDVKELLWPAVAPEGEVVRSKRALQDIARDLRRSARFKGKPRATAADDTQATVPTKP